MNKKFFIVSLIIIMLGKIITYAFKLNTHNTLWSGIFLLLLMTSLCIGCVINSVIYKKRESALRFLFYYFSFMCSIGILLIAILTPIILKNINGCLIILCMYILMSVLSLSGYLIYKKQNNQNKTIFVYFTILFVLSLIVHSGFMLSICFEN